MVYGASRYTVFDDEALSCRLYAAPMASMLRGLWAGADPDPPLYYVLQNAWAHVAGVGPLALRAPSIAYFLIGLVVLRRAAARWFDAAAGRWTLWLAALHPAHLFFGFAARWYALMFLLVAALLWCGAPRRGGTAQPSDRAARPWGWLVTGLCAAAVCYCNYFGPVVAGLLWVGMVTRDRHDRTALRHHGLAALAALVMYGPWMPVFWHHATAFPQVGGAVRDYLATAARLGMTLVSGNLAGPTAMHVWVPMAVGMLFWAATLAALRPRPGTLLWLVAGALAAGIGSRVLLDKYVMTISGPVCMLMGAVLARGLRGPAAEDAGGAMDESAVAPAGAVAAAGPSWRRPGFARFAAAGLMAGWLGCMVNLATGRHWSSLRWLDPFESVTRALYEANWSRSMPDAVCSHPSARYYFARHRVTDGHDSMIEKQLLPSWRHGLRTDAAEWLAAWEEQEAVPETSAVFALTPAAATAWLGDAGAKPRVLITLETAGFSDLPDWAALRAVLRARYRPAGEPLYYLADESAAWKDRLDPAFRHPPWRITVRHWSRRGVADDEAAAE